MPRINGLSRNGHGRHFMQAWELYPLLADRGLMQPARRHPSKLTDRGGRVGINGVLIVVLSKAEAEAEAQRRNQPFVHRVFAECDCGRLVPFGKLGQHRKACSANLFGE